MQKSKFLNVYNDLVTRKSNHAFTLVELLTVIGILAILATIAFWMLNPLQQLWKGHDAVRKSDLKKIQTAFENYYEDKGCYPASTTLNNCNGAQLQPYLDSIPCDPVSKRPYTYYPDTTMTSTCIQDYAIFASPAVTTDPEAAIYDTCNSFVVNSPNMPETKILQGCTGRAYCKKYYGCKNGSCVLIASDTTPNCSPNYCTSDCGGVDCLEARNNCL